LDLAVDREDFTFIKDKFNPAGKRRFLYIGHTAWYKNTSFLESLAEKLPETSFSWMGGTQRLKNIKGLGKLDFSKVDAHNFIKEFDFLITVGSSDANPTTILESMAWGLIPVCSIQSGYEGFSGIRNISIDNMEEAVETINNLQSVSDEELKNWQQVNLAELENHFNWDRFCEQVLAEIESRASKDLAETSLKTSLVLLFAEWESPYFWGKPVNFYRFLKSNLKYVLQNRG
jgi:glycosyltransferase involved in cell wall biosynthesis